jgi:hypothetical protein
VKISWTGAPSAAHVHRPAVGVQADVDGLGAEAAAHERDAEVEGRLGQHRFAGCEVEHGTVARRAGANSDREHAGAADASGLDGMARRVAAIRQHDYPGDVLVAEALHGLFDRSTEVAVPGRRRQLIEAGAVHRIAEREELDPVSRPEPVADLADERARARQAGVAAIICNTHAARHVHEHGDDAAALFAGRLDGDRPQQRGDDQHERRAPKADEQQALRPPQERSHARVGGPGQDRGRAERKDVAPPR